MNRSLSIISSVTGEDWPHLVPVPILSKGSFEAIKIAAPQAKEEAIEILRSLCASDAKAELHVRNHAALTNFFRIL